mmetsp:Transcript_55844/g.104766  ORF Transcript_55844/g.104766 Transcript_55844/m.104766 type:complete len:246 (-) Transcript_55844:89-826(-)
MTALQFTALLVLPVLPPFVAAQEAYGQLNLLIQDLNYSALPTQDLLTLSSTLGGSISSALGLEPDVVTSSAGSIGSVDLHPGTMRNEWMPDQWPLMQPGKATLAHAQLQLPHPSMAFIAEQTLSGSLFESEVRKRVADSIGSDSKAIIGQISVPAAAVYQAPATTVAPHAAGPPDEEKRLLEYIGLGVLILVGVGVLLCCIRSLCLGMSTRKNLSEGGGFLQVNSYDNDVPIYEDPMKLFRGQGH